MSTQYGYWKLVIRVMAYLRQTLAILMSMLRVCLGYAKGMPRVCLRYAYSMLLLLLLTVGSSSVWGQTLPFEVTTADDITNHSEKFYWIESVGATGFYAVPHSNNQNASTTNAPTLRALWYFMESGEDEYYYIINKETGKYLKKTGNTGADNTIQVAGYAEADDAKFKFSFSTPTGITEGSWVVYPKEAGTTGWLSKKSGNLQYNLWLKVSNFGSTPVGDLNSQWKIVARDAVQWPQSGLPFVVSTSNNKNYYRINHAQSTDYNISYDANNDVTISTEYDNNTAWYFEEAATDPNINHLKYYYIVNASSGKYLKFTATTINGSNQNDKFILSDYVEGDADRFQFVVVNSYGGNVGYSIMPKLAMSKYDVNNYANSMAPSSVADNEKLDLRSDRNNSNTHWNFVSTVYPLSCSTPVITYSSETGKITITTTTSNSSIYYTTDGSNPDANSNVYSEPFVLNAGAVIKAISKKDGIIDSEIATLTVEKLAKPTISFNEETREVTITAVEGAVIYYTTNDTDPTIEETTAHAASPIVIEHALPSTKIHAQAVKSGSINSDVATKTDIPVRVLTNPIIILAEDEFVYDGSAKEPAITVKDDDMVVSADEYVVTYSNNTNVGTASVTISDKADGDYQVNDGSKNFTISPKSLGDGNTAAEGITVEMTEDGLLSAVKDGSTTLIENTDYTQEAEEDGSDKIITITGIGNYTGGAIGIYASPAFVDPDGGGSGQAAAVYQAKRDMSSPTGINPYIIRKVNPTIGTAVITPLEYIPEDVPVLLLSDDEVSGFVASPKDPSTPDVTAQTKNSNQLKMSAGGETVEAAQIYIFYKGEFVLAKGGILNEGKFYLYNPNYTNTAGSGNSGNAGARGLLQFIIEDEETTGITELNNSKTKEQDTDVWYTLDGRRLSVKPSKPGIYIHQGKKKYIKRQ